MSAAVTSTGWLSNPRNVALAALFAVALSLAVAIGVYNKGAFPGSGPGGVGDAVRQGVNQGLNGINALGETVAGLFGSRSPGERAQGTLANMKQRRGQALHQRALPKVRRGPSAAIVGASPVPPAAAPLYNVVTDVPKTGVPGTPIGFTPTPGGPGGFLGLTPSPGGGGIFVPPPVTIAPPETPTTPTTPTTPVTPTAPVPEPASWIMMLVGFLVMGSMLRRRPRAALLSPS